jgi:CTP synthase
VGDIESLPFLEAIRQFRADVGRENVLYAHVALVPYVAAAGELKTKPVQHSVKELRAVGISPDVILCRTDRFLSRSVKQKIALFCNVDDDAVITAKDVESIYEVPLVLPRRGPRREDRQAAQHLDRAARPGAKWQDLLERIRHPERTVTIAMVGKYVDLTESYKSLNEALYHASFAHRSRVVIEYVDSEKLDGPGAAGPCRRDPGAARLRRARRRGQDRGGALRARARHPVLRDLLRLQMAVIEFARHVAGLDRANSTEVDPETPYPVIDFLPEQRGVTDKGATMRLGAWPCVLRKGTLAFAAYGREEISERHRHRYEVNPELRDQLSAPAWSSRGSRRTAGWSR